ncbi:MAG: M23 family metallopeptidase [Candidatus Margulisiibacteriota bacterium]
MDKNTKKQRFYTIMVVPHDARGKPVSIKLPASWVYTAVTLTCFFLLVVGSSIVYSTLLSRRLVDYADTVSKNKQQEAVISSFSAKTDKVARQIDELVKKDNELRKQLGLKGWEIKEVRTTVPTAEKVNYLLEKAEERLAQKRKSHEELLQWVSFVRSRYAATPSTWPIYGRLVSFFGYRRYPWRGMHTGVDIQAGYGAGVRATAPGVVTYTGWRHGYGKTVEISHGHGVATLYAHNSNYAVKVGQRIKKGQIVCYVGTTGWTTGPHLHYEVRRYDRPINPVAFLDLNMMTASRLWRE